MFYLKRHQHGHHICYWYHCSSLHFLLYREDAKGQHQGLGRQGKGTE